MKKFFLISFFVALHNFAAQICYTDTSGLQLLMHCDETNHPHSWLLSPDDNSSWRDYNQPVLDRAVDAWTTNFATIPTLTPGSPKGWNYFHFDGVDDSIYVSPGWASTNYFICDFSFKWLGYPPQDDAYVALVQTRDWRAYLRPYATDDCRVMFYLEGNSFYSTKHLISNTWYDVRFAYNNGNAILIVDDTTNTTTLTFSNRSSQITIGYDGFSSKKRYLYGDIDEVRIGTLIQADTFSKRKNILLNKELKIPLGEPKYIEYKGTNLSRPYATATMAFALRHFYADDDNAAANGAIIELCNFYEENTNDIGYLIDSMNWIGSHLFRTYTLFNHNSKFFPGRMSNETETAMLNLMWKWGSEVSKISRTTLDNGSTWCIDESENHDAQRYMPSWGFSQIFKDLPYYKTNIYADGYSPQQHYDAWTEYFKKYFTERAKKGLFIEVASPLYVMHTIKGIYDFCDFAEDECLKKRAEKLLTLWWASWAEEQIYGVRGGAKCRSYLHNCSELASCDTMAPVGWLYFGLGGEPAPNDFNILFMTSYYLPPRIIENIATNLQGRGNYEITQRRMGLAKNGYYNPPDYRLRTDFGGIVRYSYCTPDSIMGSFFLKSMNYTNWVMISSQNRWQGIIFADHPDMRIYPELKAAYPNKVYNPFWAVQKKNAMIVQKLDSTLHGLLTRVRFSRIPKTNIVEKYNWIFVKTQNSYTAVKPASGNYVWEYADSNEWATFNRAWIQCQITNTPVIFQLARKNDFANFDAFCSAITSLPVTITSDKVTFKTLDDDLLTIYKDYSNLPEINGETINLSPTNTFTSPFIQENWNTGFVTITNGNEKIVLNFNSFYNDDVYNQLLLHCDETNQTASWQVTPDDNSYGRAANTPILDKSNGVWAVDYTTAPTMMPGSPRCGNYLRFDGINDSIYISPGWNGANNVFCDFSLRWLGYPPASAPYAGLIQLAPWRAYLRPADGTNCYVNFLVGNTWVHSDKILFSNVWYDVHFSVKDNMAELIVGNITNTTAVVLTNRSYSIQIGCDYNINAHLNDRFFYGDIDEIRIATIPEQCVFFYSFLIYFIATLKNNKLFNRKT